MHNILFGNGWRNYDTCISSRGGMDKDSGAGQKRGAVDARHIGAEDEGITPGVS